MDETLWFIHKYFKDAAEKDESLDDVLVPMLENVKKWIHIYIYIYNIYIFWELNCNAFALNNRLYAFFGFGEIEKRQQSLRSKDVKHSHGGQTMILLNWLFQDEFLFQAVVRNLAKIIATKDDHFIALGWCTLVRGLVDYESFTDQYPMNGNPFPSFLSLNK